MSYENGSTFKHVLQLLLSPVVDSFYRYVDICDDVHMRDANRNTMLHWAAAVGNTQAAYKLLQNGLEVDACNIYGATPMLVAAAFCPNVGVMGSLLVQYGASLTVRLNSVNQDGVPSLLAARGLTPLWTWLSTMKAMLQNKEDETIASHLRPNRTVALPGAALVNTVAPLLCAPEDIRQLSSGCLVHTPAPSAAAAPPTVPIPRAPARQRSLQSGNATKPASTPAPVAVTPAAQEPSTSQVDDPAPSPLSTELPTREMERERQAAMRLIDSNESAGRLRLEKEQLESFLELHMHRLSTWPPASRDDSSEKSMPRWSTSLGNGDYVSEEDAVYSGLVGYIHAVLGEKCGPDGYRYLLVQCVQTLQKSLLGDDATNLPEVWCPLSAVASDPIVAAYVDSCSRTYTLTSFAKHAAAATPSILLGGGFGGTPLDTIEREQLEAQLRLLPRRNLSNLWSLSSIIPATKSVSPVQPINLPAVPGPEAKLESERVGAQPSTTSGGAAAVPEEARAPAVPSNALPAVPTPGEENTGRASWRFARRAVDEEEAEPVQDRWAATAPVQTAVQPTLSERRSSKEPADHIRSFGAAATCAVTPASTVVPVAAAAAAAIAALQEQMLVLPAPASNVNTLLLESSMDTNAGTSAPTSTTHTQGPRSSGRQSAEEPESPYRRYYLSDTQRAKYSSYLRDAALQRLHERRNRRPSHSPKA